MVFHDQCVSVACYRYEKFKTSDDPANENSGNRVWTRSRCKTRRRMATTRTGNAVRPRSSKVAPELRADAVGANRERGWLGEPTMIPISIFWALVLALFATNLEQHNERK